MVVINFLLGNFIGSLKFNNFTLLLLFRFEERFQGSLTLVHLLHLGLVAVLLVNQHLLCIHQHFSTQQAITHSSTIQELSFYPNVCIFEWVSCHLIILSHILFQVLVIWMGQDTLVIFSIWVISKCNVLKIWQLEY